MVTHNVREAARLADRLLLLNGRPAALVGDVAVPLPRGARSGDSLSGFLATLPREHPDTVLPCLPSLPGPHIHRPRILPPTHRTVFFPGALPLLTMVLSTLLSRFLLHTRTIS